MFKLQQVTCHTSASKQLSQSDAVCVCQLVGSQRVWQFCRATVMKSYAITHVSVIKRVLDMQCVPRGKYARQSGSLHHKLQLHLLMTACMAAAATGPKHATCLAVSEHACCSKLQYNTTVRAVSTSWPLSR